MKLQNGNLSIGLFDILCVVFFPITLLVLPSYFLGRRKKATAEKISGPLSSNPPLPFWAFAQFVYWILIVGTAGFLTSQTLTFNRTVTSVDEQTHTEVSGCEVMDYALVEIEESPKLCNIEKLWKTVPGKTYQFCRSGSGDWFEVAEDGALIPVRGGGEGHVLPIWELNRDRYLARLYHDHKAALKNTEHNLEKEQEQQELEAKIRTRLNQ